MPQPTMSRSTSRPSDRDPRRLSEVARHVVIPSGIVTTGWPAVEKRCSEWGVVFDEWQSSLGRIILGKRANGDYAATVGGVTLSIPRQVAKTFFVGRLVIALCTLFPGLTVVWSAHRTRTATKTFGSMKAFAGKSSLRKYLMPDRSGGLRSTNGEQEIHFANGSVIMFGAREGGFGRGFDQVDIAVYDEAQILTDKALEDMVPATNQSQHPHGALLFYMGTPPRPVDPGEVFASRRDDALEVLSERLAGNDPEYDGVYVECSADPDADPDDREQWGIANPSYPRRTPLRSMLRMRKNLRSIESWLREALGIWDDPDNIGRVIPGNKWSDADGEESELTSPRLAVDLRTGTRQALAIATVSVRADGFDDVDLTKYVVGAEEQWARDFAVAEVQRIMREQKLEQVTVDQYGEGNGLLIAQLEEAGVKVQKLNVADMRSGAVGIVNAIINGTVKHHGSQELTAAVLGAKTRKSNNGFLWDQDKADADLTPLRAVTAAWWALQVSRDLNYDIKASYY